VDVRLVDLRTQYYSIKREIDDAVASVLDSGYFVLGENVKSFEKEFSAYCGASYGLGLNSGTDALLLALKALGVSRGDEVILPAFTISVDAGVVGLVGATPVLADIERDTFNLDASSMEERITDRTKAVIAVDLYGLPADFDGIRKTVDKIPIVEDACQAAGSEYKQSKAGNLADVGCFSFYPTKNLGCAGDGGMLLTNDEVIAGRVRILRANGESKPYEQDEFGLNSRLDEVQAAVLLVKLKYLDRWNEERRKRAKIYDEELSGVVTVPTAPSYAKHIYHQYTILAEKRDRLQEFLSKNGVQTKVHYPKPLHMQKSMAFRGYKLGDFPQSEEASTHVLSLPVYPETSTDQIEFVAKKIKEFYRK
jgi:dTDP-4-amino-4,6-dideoxygalactose transaminase